MKLEDFLKGIKKSKPLQEDCTIPELEIIEDEEKYTVVKIKDKKDFVVLFLDNEDKIDVQIETYFSLGIKKDTVLPDKLYKQLLDEEKALHAYQACLRKLAVKDYSSRKIEEFIYNKYDLHNSDVEEIMNKLKSYGLLDDEKYVQSRIKLLNDQLNSYKQIKYKLEQDEVSSDLIKRYLNDDSKQEYNKVVKLAEKLASKKTKKSLKAFKQSILKKIVSSGYSYDLAEKAIGSIKVSVFNEIDLLKKEYAKQKKKYAKKYKGYELRTRIYNALLSKGFDSKDIKKVLED